MSTCVELIPLGGIGEFGMNCAALRSGEEMILIDAGMSFPRGLGSDLGIDVIVPDISFLLENAGQLKAIVLTHGHEDHVGAVSHIVRELPVPVYGSRLTIELVRSRLHERKMENACELHAVDAPFQIGPFEIDPMRVTHSIPDARALCIQTPVGRLIWTGDFKFDSNPVDGRLSDTEKLESYGDRGVLALFSDSTNAEVPGPTPSESEVRKTFEELFHSARQKLIVSCFSSHVHRVQMVIDLARECDRWVAPMGRSLVNSSRIAAAAGYLEDPDGRMISVREAADLPPRQAVILASGCQGEPLAALSRLAVDEDRHIGIEEGDTVILSARIIPGNEKWIANMVNHLYRRGARVYDSQFSRVHASGHGYREDLKRMIELTRPRFFVPVHGEYKQLSLHRSLAEEAGLHREDTILIENGDVLELTADRMQTNGTVAVGRRFMEEGLRHEIHEVVLRDRRFLSEDGIVVVVLRIDRLSGDLVGSPELISRGFVVEENAEDVMEAASLAVEKAVDETPAEEKRDEELFNEILRTRLRIVLRKKTGKRPIILPVTIEI